MSANGQIFKAKYMHEHIKNQVDIEGFREKLHSALEGEKYESAPDTVTTTSWTTMARSRSKERSSMRPRFVGVMAGLSGALSAIGILYVVASHNSLYSNSDHSRNLNITKTTLGSEQAKSNSPHISKGHSSTVTENAKLGLIQPKLPRGFYIVHNQILHSKSNPHLLLDISNKSDTTESVVIDEFITSQKKFPNGMGKYRSMKVNNVPIRIYSSSSNFSRYEFIDQGKYFDITTTNVRMKQARFIIVSLLR